MIPKVLQRSEFVERLHKTGVLNDRQLSMACAGHFILADADSHSSDEQTILSKMDGKTYAQIANCSVEDAHNDLKALANLSIF